jgi:hypothetical protein
MNRKTPAGLVAKIADGWAVIDKSGDIVVYSVSPTRIECVKCRLGMMGYSTYGNVPDEAIESFWQDHKDPVEEVVRVRVSMLLS